MPKTIGQLKKDKRTKKKQQEDFLQWLGEYASVSRAAKKAKVARSNVYQWLKADEEFKKKYDEACEVALGALEDEAVRRAHEGTLKPVYQKGEKVGVIREYSDTLMIVLLKARAPEKYKERAQIDARNTNVNYNAEVTPEEVKRIAKDLEEEY